MVVQIIAQGLVDSLNRLSLVVPEKMFNIFEHEGLWSRLCKYSFDLKEQSTLRLVLKSMRSIQTIFFLRHRRSRRVDREILRLECHRREYPTRKSLEYPPWGDPQSSSGK